ncbi:dTDP-4-dehydrorhamnose 3,5-epimerase [Terasakiella sp. A23]|uniref:dTDP-4-dehydrorhamnose 3,5-epimerase n=1 Tax=Terasakiella sp. FCG-A23 TaxID=3080561 RepID=UPI002954EF13|nr:dTDP-4-dehydrorhamnose 3,5-epimerase [Terasakiella sp. A23]MDV7341632.1 dTDP-4-dehydrorhamnose 3,5-epimerase [Terasakiella sp. A23]
MKTLSLSIPEVKLITPKKFGDERGFFSETYNCSSLSEYGIDINFVQDNHSMSHSKGVLRGLHYQKPPFAQDKLVRVVRGKIWDVAIDLRPDSVHYKKWVAAEVSADNWSQILVPKGFAHGFVTLEEDTEVIYKVSDYYNPESEVSIMWNDEALNIDWPVDAADVVLSRKDAAGLSFSNLEDELKTYSW